MTGLFFFLAAVALLLFLHPYSSYPFSLRYFRPRPLAIRADAPLPSATMVFSAYNEEQSLPAKIDNLRQIKQKYPWIEIIAYSDKSSDATLQLLNAASDILHVIAAQERTGKAIGMRKMVARASGEIVIFTDANVILDVDSIEPLLRYFSDPNIGGVAGTLRYINEDASATAKVGGLYWRLEEKLKQKEARIGSIMGADGSIFATRRELYPEVPAHLLDDMTASMTVTFRGKRLIHATDVVAYEKNATSDADEFRRKRRIACRAFNTHRYLWPTIRQHYNAVDQYKYISHKLLRWFGLMPLLGAILCFSIALILADCLWLLGVCVAVGVMALIFGKIGLPLFSGLYQILVSIIATFLGVMDSLRGKTYQTWTPAASRN
ncbi:MAG: glycosyltransferase [Sphingobium sp.]|nr:glycosyltransferase [Sphingobium sp.]